MLTEIPVAPDNCARVTPRCWRRDRRRGSARADVLASLRLEPTEQQVDGHVIGSYLPADPPEPPR